MDSHAPNGPAPPDEEERLLVERARTDPAALGEIYELYYPRIAGYILRRVGHAQDAQDLTTDTFLKVMKALPCFEWRGASFSAWIYRIATNETDSYFRRRRRRCLSLDFLSEKWKLELPDSAGSIEQQTLAVEAQLAEYEAYQKILKLTQALPVKYQAVLALRYFENKRLAELGEITGKNLNTVKSLLSRATRKLRIAYEAAEPKAAGDSPQPFERLGVIADVRRNQP